jgi:crotonobetainyl-CoA:carnitine CoA-transferase CaiB-like acyl-CoA transferase
VVVRPDELASDAHLRARGLFAEIGAGDEAVQVFRTPVSPRQKTFDRAPHAGEHSRAILGEAGLDAHEIDALVAAGVVKSAGG